MSPRLIAFLVAVTGAGLLATASLGSVAQAGGPPLTALLSGAAEVLGPGDRDGTGTRRITVNP